VISGVNARVEELMGALRMVGPKGAEEIITGGPGRHERLRSTLVTDFDLKKLDFTLAATIRGEIFDEA
jgi:hypothetical protein